jgi:phosphoribosylaminoimidazole-succinocarboxamide synthase
LVLQFNNNKTLYEELSKKDFPLDDHNYLILEISDYFSEDGAKKIKSKNLSERFAQISSFFFDYLKEYHIPSAFVKTHNKNSLKFLKHTRYPFSVKIFNLIDKKTARIFHKKENEQLSLPIFEIHYNNGKDTLISDSHLITFDICTNEDLRLIYRICSKVNAVLKSFFERRNYILAEVNCCFGKSDDKIYLVDDFSPKSLKIVPSNSEQKTVNPFKITSPSEAKKYTEHLYNVMSS